MSFLLKVDVTVGLHVHEKCAKTETVQQRSAIMAARTKGQINELKKRFCVSDASKSHFGSLRRCKPVSLHICRYREYNFKPALSNLY